MTHDQLKCALILLGWKETKFSFGPAVWNFKNNLYGLRVYNTMEKDINTGKKFKVSFYPNYGFDCKCTTIFTTYIDALKYITENT